ncbi:MAG: glycosyltransferase family 39 protein [Chloroflexi bacterium]|nr:glycosyltransferase family 39 protein [Chloroflexota bacterium]
MAADHYRLPRPVGPSPGIRLGAVRPSAAEAVRSMLLLLRARTGWLEALALTALWLLAVGIRAPHLGTIPAIGDDAGMLAHAFERSQAGLWTGSVASSVGAAHELLLALALAVFGPSPYVPRLVTAMQAALTIPLVYVLTRELCRPLGRRRIEEAFLMPRLAGLVAAGLLATSSAHIVVTSHVARPESFTPLLVIALLYTVERALNTRNGRWLLASGTLFGLALQTSPLVMAILPGLVLAGWWRGRALMLSHWAAVAMIGFLGAYAGTITGWLRHGTVNGLGGLGGLAAWMAGERYHGPSGEMYLDSVGTALVSLWRMLAGQLTSRPPAENVLSDPLAWPFVLLAVLGALVLALRGRPLLPLVAVSCLVVLPYIATDADPLLSGRYLMPVAVVGMVAIAVAVGALAPIVTGRGSLPRLALGMVLGGLVLAPLGGLRSYYEEKSAERQTSAGLLLIPNAIFAERRYDEVVLLDERLAHVSLGAGGNTLEALQYLLAASGVPTQIANPLQPLLPEGARTSRALIVLDEASVATVEETMRLTPLLGHWIDAEDNASSLMLFRAESLTPNRGLDDDELPLFAGEAV